MVFLLISLDGILWDESGVKELIEDILAECLVAIGLKDHVVPCELDKRRRNESGTWLSQVQQQEETFCFFKYKPSEFGVSIELELEVSHHDRRDLVELELGCQIELRFLVVRLQVELNDIFGLSLFILLIFVI